MDILEGGIRGRVYHFLHSDTVRSRMLLRPFQYNIFRALCGNKFTRNLLSLTMIMGVQSLTDEEAIFINSLRNNREIAASFIFLGIKYGGRLKPLRKTHKGSDSYKKFDDSLELFLRYVDTGLKPMTERIYINTPLMSRKILSDMRDGCQIFKAEELKNWSGYVTIERAINNARIMWKNKKVLNSVYSRRPRIINT